MYEFIEEFCDCENDGLIFGTNVLINCILWQWFELLQKTSEKQGREKGFHVGAWKWRGYHVQVHNF